MRQSAFHSGFVDQGQVASKCALVTDVFAALWEVLGGSQEPDEEETKEDEKAVPVSPSPGSFLSGPLKTSAQVCELVQDDTAIKWKKLATKTLREVRFPSFRSFARCTPRKEMSELFGARKAVSGRTQGTWRLIACPVLIVPQSACFDSSRLRAERPNTSEVGSAI